MGAGRTALAGAIAGLTPADMGEIRVNGRRVRIRGPRDAISSGIALVSEDRARYGLVPGMSVKHNVTLASLDACSRGWFIDRRGEDRVADEQMRGFSIKSPGRDRKVSYLSGGNQQKVVIARTLLTDPAVLILDEPTRGIDIAAKAEVHAIIRRLARHGKAVIMASSEMTEILSLSDRVLVMREGEITAELSPRHTTQEEIMKWAMPN
jgi:inositol transport system ATP-binding protein